MINPLKTYLFNSQGKQLYTLPENIKKASRRRKVGKPICEPGVYTPGLSLYKREPMKELTI